MSFGLGGFALFWPGKALVSCQEGYSLMLPGKFSFGFCLFVRL